MIRPGCNCCSAEFSSEFSVTQAWCNWFMGEHFYHPTYLWKTGGQMDCCVNVYIYLALIQHRTVNQLWCLQFRLCTAPRNRMCTLTHFSKRWFRLLAVHTASLPFWKMRKQGYTVWIWDYMTVALKCVSSASLEFGRSISFLHASGLWLHKHGDRFCTYLSLGHAIPNHNFASSWCPHNFWLTLVGKRSCTMLVLYCERPLVGCHSQSPGFLQLKIC